MNNDNNNKQEEKIEQASLVNNYKTKINEYQSSIKESIEQTIGLIEAGEGGYVAENLEKFHGLDHVVANKLIDAGYGYSVLQKT